MVFGLMGNLERSITNYFNLTGLTQRRFFTNLTRKTKRLQLEENKIQLKANKIQLEEKRSRRFKSHQEVDKEQEPDFH